MSDHNTQSRFCRARGETAERDGWVTGARCPACEPTDDHEHEVGMYRDLLDRSLSRAVDEARAAHRALTRLTSNTVYDVEYVETETGPRIERLLTQAGDLLAAAAALTPKDDA